MKLNLETKLIEIDSLIIDCKASFIVTVKKHKFNWTEDI